MITNDSAQDVVFIQGLEAECVIGVHEPERAAPQAVVVDLELRTDTRRAARGDDLAASLDYEAVSNLVLQVVRSSRFRLIEALAEAIADSLLAAFEIPELAVTVHKPSAVPLAADVGVRIVRRHAESTGGPPRT